MWILLMHMLPCFLEWVNLFKGNSYCCYTVDTIRTWKDVFGEGVSVHSFKNFDWDATTKGSNETSSTSCMSQSGKGRIQFISLQGHSAHAILLDWVKSSLPTALWLAQNSLLSYESFMPPLKVTKTFWFHNIIDLRVASTSLPVKDTFPGAWVIRC